MYNVRIGITDDTTPDDLDQYFTNIWKHNKKVRLVFDTTQCENVSFRRMMGMKPVLNKHRPNSRKFIDHSVIVVKSGLVCSMLKLALKIIRTERPVEVIKSSIHS
mgnify:FL=1